jgi:WD40 repeat protein
LAFSPDGNLVASGGENGAVRLWDFATARHLQTFAGHKLPVTCVAYSPTGRFVVSGSEDRTLKLWDVATGREGQTFIGHANAVVAVAFSPDGKSVLSGSAGRGGTVRELQTAGPLMLWDVATGRASRTLEWRVDREISFGGCDWNVTLSPDGRLALSAGYPGFLALWDVDTGQSLRSFGTGLSCPTRAVFSPDARFLVAPGYAGFPKLWDVATGRELRTFASTGHVDGFSPDGKFVMGRGSMGLIVWHVDTGREMKTFASQTFPDYGYGTEAFSRDGTRVILGGNDGTVQLFDFARPVRYREFDTLLPKAREAIQKNENDPEALKTLGEWYAFRGVNDWAVDMLEKARKNGARVSPLTLARCYWQLAEDEHETTDKHPVHRAAAVAEFQKELDRVKAQRVPQEPKAKLAREQEELYLSLCLQAVSKPVAQDADKK